MTSRAVLFDFDGLIVDTEMPEYLAWRTVYARRGLTFPLDSWLKNVGRNDRPFDPFEPLLRDGEARREAILAEWRECYDAIEPAYMVPLPGVVSLLHRLRDGGWRVGIGSSSRRARVAALVDRLGLGGQFGAIAGGDEVPQAKPAPDVYLLAARRLDVPPGACTVLEDSENGVRAAKAAGMRCIAVPSALTRSLDFSAADAVLAGLQHVTLQALAAGPPGGAGTDPA